MTSQPPLASERLDFPDLLRGVAALTVVLGHFVVLFLKSPNVVANFTAAEPLPATVFPAAVDAAYSIFNLPGIGVGVFFLISGFVIPLSLETGGATPYFLKRLLRIFPTYWVALVIGVGAIFISAAFWSKTVPYGLTDYFANALLIADFYGRLDIISVMWTLQIELKFYLLAPLFFLALRKRSILSVMLWGLGVLAAYWLAIIGCEREDVASCWSRLGFISRISWEAMFISYMLIGSVLYAHYRRLLANWQVAVGVTFLLTSFMVAAPLSSAPALADAYGLAFLWGFAIFLPFYLLRERITLTPPFRFLANISYPLYVIHPLAGYVAMRMMIAAGLPYVAAFAAALALVVAAATIIHMTVEAPSIALGKRLATALALAPKTRLPAAELPVQREA